MCRRGTHSSIYAFLWRTGGLIYQQCSADPRVCRIRRQEEVISRSLVHRRTVRRVRAHPSWSGVITQQDSEWRRFGTPHALRLKSELGSLTAHSYGPAGVPVYLPSRLSDQDSGGSLRWSQMYASAIILVAYVLEHTLQSRSGNFEPDAPSEVVVKRLVVRNL